MSSFKNVDHIGDPEKDAEKAAAGFEYRLDAMLLVDGVRKKLRMYLKRYKSNAEIKDLLEARGSSVTNNFVLTNIAETKVKKKSAPVIQDDDDGTDYISVSRKGNVLTLSWEDGMTLLFTDSDEVVAVRSVRSEDSTKAEYKEFTDYLTSKKSVIKRIASLLISADSSKLKALCKSRYESLADVAAALK